MTKEIKVILDEIERLYFNKGYSIDQIALELNLTETAIRNGLVSIEKKRNELDKENQNKNSKLKEIKKNALKSLNFIESLDGEALVKIDYANDWSRASGELVKHSLKGQMALSYARNLVYTNQLDDLVEIINWQKEELRAVRQNMRTNQINSTEATEQIKAIKLMANEQIKAIGVKSDKALSDLIDKIGNLNVSEERLRTEKAKIIADEENDDKTIELLKQIGGLD